MGKPIPNSSDAETFITSRGYPLPKTKEKMAESLWYNMWQRKLWPYLELTEGSTLYWYDGTEQAIVWMSRVKKVEKFAYSDKESVKRRLRRIFGISGGFDSYFDSASSNGYCLAYKVDSLVAGRVPKPPMSDRFPQRGWLRFSDDQAQDWFASLAQGNSFGEDADVYEPTGEDRREIVLQEVRQRQGQPLFRQRLVQRYGPACMISGCNVAYVIEAAHIQPFRGEDDNHAQNGLLLRSDLHTLFDLGLLGIEPSTLTVRVHASLLGTEYATLNGGKIRCEKRKPSDTAMQIRWRDFLDRGIQT